MEFETVLAAIEQNGSINRAAKALGVHAQTLTLWIARSGYEVVHAVTLRPIVAVTDAGRSALAATPRGEMGLNVSDDALKAVGNG